MFSLFWGRFYFFFIWFYNDFFRKLSFTIFLFSNLSFNNFFVFWRRENILNLKSIWIINWNFIINSKNNFFSLINIFLKLAQKRTINFLSLLRLLLHFSSLYTMFRRFNLFLSTFFNIFFRTFIEFFFFNFFISVFIFWFKFFPGFFWAFNT